MEPRIALASAALLPLLLAASAAAAPAAHADVWVDSAESGGRDPAGFVGLDGGYVVAGVVKSSEDRPAAPVLAVTVEGAGGAWSASRTFGMAAIPAGGELPFRVSVQIPAGAPAAAAAAGAEHQARVVGFAAGVPLAAPAGAEVVYDRTLRVREDGTVAGLVRNIGAEEIPGVIVAAVAHGRSHEVLDVVATDGPAGPIPPGGSAAFEMRPDPSVGPDVWYYSCFALGEPGIVVLRPMRNGEPFPMRYTSGVLLSYPAFDEAGEVLTMRVIPGWPLQTYVNLEFPRHSDGEEFEILLDGEPADALQSRDDMGNWHVSLSIEDQYAGTLTISGFAPGTTSADRRIEVPEWIRDEAGQWSLGQVDDARFLENLAYLAGGGVIDAGPAGAAAAGDGPAVPPWVRDSAAWWSQGLVSDEEFVDAVEHLVSIGAVRIA